MHINLNERKLVNYLLLPLAGVFYILAVIRKQLYALRILKSYKAKVPVIIVGNITVGGSGKTPVVIALVQQLQQQGKKVGVISRGYGRTSTELVVIDKQTKVLDCGDEPYLIWIKTQALVAVSASKIEAVRSIEKKVDVIISDDGLQHYALQRDIEIVVYNGVSNGWYLPAGGLREGKKRLQNVDMVITESDKEVIPTCFIHAQTGTKYPLTYFQDSVVIAICGIANPQRFRNTLERLGVRTKWQVFPDHHSFCPEDLQSSLPVITTAKDWVKYKDFAADNVYYLDIDIVFTATCTQAFTQLFNDL